MGDAVGLLLAVLGVWWRLSWFGCDLVKGSGFTRPDNPGRGGCWLVAVNCGEGSTVSDDKPSMSM